MIIWVNACTLVPTVFRWHGEREFKCHFHFSFSHDIEKQIWILLFVFRFRLTLKNGFELRISFSHLFEKRIWISVFVFRFRITLKNGYEFRFSFFVFALLWKTDLNFVSRFLITLKNRSEFRLSFLHNHLKPTPPRKVSFLSSFPGYNKLLHHKLLNNWATWTGKNKTRLVNFSYKWHKKCVRDVNKTGLS